MDVSAYKSLRQTLSEAIGGSEMEIPPGQAAEIWARLPFGTSLDDRVHNFPLAQPYVRAQDSEVFGDPPWISISLHRVNVERAPLIRPGFTEGLRVLLQLEGPDPSKEPPSDEGGYDDWVRIVTPGAPLQGESDDPLDALLERGLLSLNRILRAYRFVSENPMVRPISVEDLDPFVLLRSIDAEGNLGPWSFAAVHAMLPVSPTLLSDDEQQRIDTVIDMQGNGHPFITYRDWLERAKYARFVRGDHANAIINLQTAVESFIIAVLVMVRVDQGLKGAQINMELAADQGFQSLFTRQMHGFLEGLWDTTRKGTPVGDYWTHLYLVRNRIVHTGYVPTFADTERAFQAQQVLNDFIVNRIHARWRRYPRTLLALLGEPGLARRGWLSAGMRDFIRQAMSEQKPFWWP
jgi:hypothetical protein